MGKTVNIQIKDRQTEYRTLSTKHQNAIFI